MVLAKATPKVNREFVDSENSFFRRSRGDILKGNLNMTFEARRQAVLISILNNFLFKNILFFSPLWFF